MPAHGAGTGDAPPILFRLAEKECAVHGGRKRRFVSKSCPFGQVWTSTGVVRDGAVETWELVPGAPYPYGTERVLPRIWGRGSGFRGGCRMVPTSLSAAALPTSNQPALSEAGSAEIVAGQIR